MAREDKSLEIIVIGVENGGIYCRFSDRNLTLCLSEKEIDRISTVNLPADMQRKLRALRTLGCDDVLLEMLRLAFLNGWQQGGLKKA